MGKKILVAAFKLFALQGYSRTSVENIAHKANISKGLIYHYFDSKEAILKGLFILFREEMDKLYQWDTENTPEEVLQMILDTSTAFITQKSQINRMMIALAIQPEVTESIRAEMEELRERWYHQLVGVFTKMGYKDAETEAYFLCAILDGAAVGYMATSGEYPLEEINKLIKKRYRLI